MTTYSNSQEYIVQNFQSVLADTFPGSGNVLIADGFGEELEEFLNGNPVSTQTTLFISFFGFDKESVSTDNQSLSYNELYSVSVLQLGSMADYRKFARALWLRFSNAGAFVIEDGGQLFSAHADVVAASPLCIREHKFFHFDLTVTL